MEIQAQDSRSQQAYSQTTQLKWQQDHCQGILPWRKLMRAIVDQSPAANMIECKIAINKYSISITIVEREKGQEIMHEEATYIEL